MVRMLRPRSKLRHRPGRKPTPPASATPAKAAAKGLPPNGRTKPRARGRGSVDSAGRRSPGSRTRWGPSPGRGPPTARRRRSRSWHSTGPPPAQRSTLSSHQCHHGLPQILSDSATSPTAKSPLASRPGQPNRPTGTTAFMAFSYAMLPTMAPHQAKYVRARPPAALRLISPASPALNPSP